MTLFQIIITFAFGSLLRAQISIGYDYDILITIKECIQNN